MQRRGSGGVLVSPLSQGYNKSFWAVSSLFGLCSLYAVVTPRYSVDQSSSTCPTTCPKVEASISPLSDDVVSLLTSQDFIQGSFRRNPRQFLRLYPCDPYNVGSQELFKLYPIGTRRELKLELGCCSVVERLGGPRRTAKGIGRGRRRGNDVGVGEVVGYVDKRAVGVWVRAARGEASGHVEGQAYVKPPTYDYEQERGEDDGTPRAARQHPNPTERGLRNGPSLGRSCSLLIWSDVV
ncbi:hypothetical protein FIBSPDRAFT_882233 [Athelia psychrophila]|uniref:Uncharacterized protein n=1 Tax=Athelia psychrophila TaxID=1759441 RepID=A0A166VPA7_9AGAM|nr:hypothetical protein FIBSPDRAFT_882233 [Fibularhizoctonia sp. CBS 109695]